MDIKIVEQEILQIWKEVFHNQCIGINDNFFVIGGDSIKAIKILERLKQKNMIFDQPSMNWIYSNLTVESMANYVTERTNIHLEEGEL